MSEIDDNELIWENYITANWGYTNYNTPTSNKYSNIPSPTKDSYYQQGKFPTGAGLATAYTPSSDEEEIIVTLPRMNNRETGEGQDFYIVLPKNYYTKIGSNTSKIRDDKQFKQIILGKLNKFIKQNPYFAYMSSTKNRFYRLPIQYDNFIANNNDIIKNLSNVVLTKDGELYKKIDKIIDKKNNDSKITKPIQMEFKI